MTAIGTLAKACSFTNCAVFICFGKIYVAKMIHPYFVACGISAPSFRRMYRHGVGNVRFIIAKNASVTQHFTFVEFARIACACLKI